LLSSFLRGRCLSALALFASVDLLLCIAASISRVEIVSVSAGDTDIGQIGALVDAQLTAVLDGGETGSKIRASRIT
jgi:hypothetical protein